MKKLLTFLMAAALCAACAFTVAGCNKNSAAGVTLIEVSSDDVGRVSAKDGGRPEQLFGENAYPQALLVAKKSLVENDGAFVTEFLAEYAGTADWLAAQTSHAEIVSAINSHGGTTLKAPMLSFRRQR